MATKRTASSDLNHDNWDHDEEPEAAGIFERASEESLKRRIIKTARRRNPISSVRTVNSEEKNAFTDFKAFSKSSAPPTTGFSFLSNVGGKTDQHKTNGTASGNTDAIASSSIPKSTNGKLNDYFPKLKGLNESVAIWIKKHVDANPFINLQPIFKDYEEYFKELEKDVNSTSVSEGKQIETTRKCENTSTVNMFVFKSGENMTEKADLDRISMNKKYTNHSLGSISAPKCTTDNKPSFGFSSTATSNTFSFANSNMSTSTMSTLSPSSGKFENDVSTSGNTNFHFSSSKPFTFSNVSQSVSNEESTKEKETEEDDEPPKVEFIPVVEKGHIYTTRCKVFIKKDSGFGDRGVGNLYLKPIENCNKIQCIVRADTNLGNVLCNFILSKSIPTKRMGKKDVMLICLPTPDVKPPPIPILLRVKSPEEANNLLDVLEKHKT